MIINLSKVDFGGITGGKAKPEEVFDVQPTTTDQTITPTEGSVFSGGTVRAVTSDIDNNIVSENIKEGVTILGVAGSHKGEKPEESFNAQPTTTEQTITPTEGKVFSGGTVHAVTSAIDSNIQPENIKEGVSILGVAGTLSGGDTPDYRYMKGTVDKAGLKAIGWTDEDILTYEQNTPPHYSWQNDQYKVSDENKALYLLDDPNPSSYKKNPNITFVPKKNMESYFNGSAAFEDMKYIKGIPFYDNSNVTEMNSIFHNCLSLTTIPQLDTSNVTNMSGMFVNCSSLTTIPQLNTSKVTEMNSMFHNCSSLTTIPQLDTSNVTGMSYMFNGCSSLTSIPQLNTSKVTDIYGMFGNCSSLTTIPQLDTSNVTNMTGLFQNSPRLTSIPQLDTSNVTSMSYMFGNSDGNYELTSIPQLDTSNVTSMEWMFQNCTNLTTLPQLNTSKVTNMSYMFWQCYNLTIVEGFDFSGLTSNPESFFGYFTEMPKLTRFIVNGKINVSMGDYSIKALTAIDYDSVKSILEAANRTDNTNEKTLAFNRSIIDRDGEIAALVASCTAKGWTITGLTFKPREDVILTCSDVVLTDGKADYVPVTIDAINDWNIARYDGGGVAEDDWLEIKVYENSTVIADAYEYSFDNWEDLTGKTAGINTANLKLGYLIGDRYRALPEGIKLIICFGIIDSNNNYYKYDITLERIDGQVTTTLHTISPNAK